MIHRMRAIRFIVLLAFLLSLPGCCILRGGSGSATYPDVAQQLTIDNIGACQGVFIWEGSAWLYGDRDGKGIIKRLEWVGPNGDAPMLLDTGETYELKLFRNRYARNNDQEKLPRNLVPHPTGITFHPDYDTFMGNTVDQKGTIYAMHFLGLTESGSLDDWISNKVVDDLANNGTRPEFVRYNGRWLVATADYGDQGNQLRLYDPDKLKNRFTLPLDGFIHLVPLGDYPHPAGIVQVIDEEAVNSMAANFASRAAGDANFPGILLDFDHFSDNPDAESRAAAWIDDIQVRHDGLWGKPKWTGTGERAVTSGEYRLVSPTWNKSDCEELGDDRCRPMILDSVALTNNPNMKGMVPISK